MCPLCPLSFASNGGYFSAYFEIDWLIKPLTIRGRVFNSHSLFIRINLQVLVEKLLRSCPDIRNIYLLIRPKRGQEVAARLTELLNAPVSEQLNTL